MTLDYFYGQAGELFSFFRIPKALFQEQRFQSLSTDAKTLYGILLDRMSLSVKNEWFDKKGRVFIIFTIEDVKRTLRCADNKATRLLRELEKFGLIERKRRGQGKPCLVYVKNFSSESSKENVKNYLCEIGLEKMPYRSSWLFKSYTEESLTRIAITAYYNVDETFLQSHTAAWGNLWDCRSALRKLVSSVYLESDLNLPFGKNGKLLFQLGYTPVVSDMNKIVKKAAASSFSTWALAVWDMDTATLYMVKYDRSH